MYVWVYTCSCVYVSLQVYHCLHVCMYENRCGVKHVCMCTYGSIFGSLDKYVCVCVCVCVNADNNVWMLDNAPTVDLRPVPVRYGCVVKPYVWFGSQNNICVINPYTLNIQVSLVGKHGM